MSIDKKYTASPYGGKLVDGIVSPKRAEELKKASMTWPSHDLTQRQLCDLELLLNGGFSPLTTFLNEADYNGVLANMRLADGTLWTMPITLDVSEEFAKSIKVGDSIALRDPEGTMLAALKVSEMYRPDLKREAQMVFGTLDELHPGVNYLMHQTKPVYLSGKLEGIQLPTYYDFKEMRRTPKELHDVFAQRSWTKIVAFQTRNPMHRAHVELAKRAAQQVEANLLINPTVGMTRPGDIDHFTRVRVYKAIERKFPPATTMISLLPLAMRMGGPREAVWHAIVRKNYGATHFISGRDHAGPGKDSDGNDFYGPYEARDLAMKFSDEIGIKIVPFEMMVFVPDQDTYMPIDEVPEGVTTANISGTELRARLRDGRPLPSWFTFPEVAAELQRRHPPRTRQGFCVFFTGLSGSGKSTIANALAVKLQELGGRSTTVLDGDIVRKNLSSELGFSKKDRDINIRRIGYVASEIAKHGGVAICAPIAPYDETRKAVRQQVEEQGGGFILAYVSTPLEVCEARDRKGLYQKARNGIIKEFTGISDPYETPEDADIVLDTEQYTPDELAQQLLLHLEKESYLDNGEALSETE